MIPYTAYDIINAVNREVDLTRQPVREYQHAFGADGNQPPQDGSGTSGPGFSVAPSLFARLTAAVRSLGSQRPKTQPTPTC
jgi:hypothetical protein